MEMDSVQNTELIPMLQKDGGVRKKAKRESRQWEKMKKNGNKKR
jgi:hypothetical protein